MPKYIEFALVIFRFLFFYVKLLFLPGFSYNQLAVLTQCFSDGQAVCYIFFKNSHLLFRIYSGFSGSSVNRSWVNDLLYMLGVHVVLFLLEFLSSRLQTLAL